MYNASLTKCLSTSVYSFSRGIVRIGALLSYSQAHCDETQVNIYVWKLGLKCGMCAS